LVDEIKKRRITEKDHEKIAGFIKDEKERRASSESRKKHTPIWKALDKQIAMEPPTAKNRSDNPNEDYHNAIQLGNLADALEIIAGDVLRHAFPVDRKWFVPHVELPTQTDEQGNQVQDVKAQMIANGVVRNFMSQQHHDFGLRDRVKASIKEGLTHGGIVAEIKTETLTKHGPEGETEQITAPVWVPHSMWNCYPDPSPDTFITNMFYKGGMIIASYMPRSKFMQSKVFFNKEKVPKQKNKPKDDVTDDVEILTFHGDLFLDRGDGDMFLPNYKIMVANGIMVFAEKNKTPYSPIIYTGYERDDVRDPYYTSPLIKRSPTQTLATEFMNTAMDGAERFADPPGYYDSYDSNLVAEGGPSTAPGSMTGIKGGGANVKFLEIGDPTVLFGVAQNLLSDIEKGTSVDRNRTGVTNSADITATEIRNNDAKGEARTLDFQGVLDRQGLLVYLNMQHDLNLMNVDKYPFYNDELNTPDFLRMSKNQLPKNIIFDVVGSKSVLGEEQRNRKFLASVEISAQIPQVSERTDWDQVSEEVWSFSGQKNAERFIKQAEENQEIQQLTQEFQQVAQQLQAQIQQLQQENALSELELKECEVGLADLNGEIKVMEEQQQLSNQAFVNQSKLKDLLHKIELQRERSKNQIRAAS
jgi:hypothetical protein